MVLTTRFLLIIAVAIMVIHAAISIWYLLKRDDKNNSIRLQHAIGVDVVTGKVHVTLNNSKYQKSLGILDF